MSSFWIRTSHSGPIFLMKYPLILRFLGDQDNEAEFRRFATEFYVCPTDTDGNPYFEADFQQR